MNSCYYKEDSPKNVLSSVVHVTSWLEMINPDGLHEPLTSPVVDLGGNGPRLLQNLGRFKMKIGKSLGIAVPWLWSMLVSCCPFWETGLDCVPKIPQCTLLPDLWSNAFFDWGDREFRLCEIQSIRQQHGGFKQRVPTSCKPLGHFRHPWWLEDPPFLRTPHIWLWFDDWTILYLMLLCSLAILDEAVMMIPTTVMFCLGGGWLNHQPKVVPGSQCLTQW